MDTLTAHVATELLAAADLLDYTARRLRRLVTDAPPLKRVCSWCQTLMRDGALPVSHGICPTCMVRFEAGDKP